MKKVPKEGFFDEIFCDSEYRGFYITIILLLTTVFLLLHYIFLGGGKKTAECLNNQNNTVTSENKGSEVNNSFAYNEKTYGNFEKYEGVIMQIGGIGSRIHQNDVWAYPDQDYFRLSEDWVDVLFNAPADIMYLSCREGFTISSCKIGEKQQDDGTIDDKWRCVVPIEDIMKNTAIIECIKNK